MVSVVLAADSSSASANRFSIQKTEWASAGVLKVYTAEGPSFFVREEYLPGGVLSPGVLLENERAEALVTAGRTYLAERAAMEYLARAEHSRFLLAQKLAKKGFSRYETGAALDYLESRGYLDDSRFAAAWLRSRSIHKTEGRLKLSAGLAARGIAGDVAKIALDDYWADHDERASCEKLAEKLAKQGKNGDALALSLVRRGFSVKLVRSVLVKKRDL